MNSVETSRSGWGEDDARAACVYNASVAAKAGKPEAARLWSVCAQASLIDRANAHCRLFIIPLQGLQSLIRTADPIRVIRSAVGTNVDTGPSLK